MAADPRIGTTRPIPIGKITELVRAGENYVAIQIVDAQVAFTGRWWQNTKNLVISSKVIVDFGGNEDQSTLRSIHLSREVNANRTEKLGLTPILVNLVPAQMASLTVSVDFVLDQQNRMSQIAGLINDSSLVAAFSLGPAAGAAAKSVGIISEKLLQAFVPAESKDPLLQFSGDFRVGADDFGDGYYVIFGTRDSDRPLPGSELKLQVQGGSLSAEAFDLDTLSYILLRISVLPARTRALGEKTAWAKKLAEAEDAVDAFVNDIIVDKKKRQETWDKCQKLLSEAQTILREDPNYLRTEAQSIIRGVMLALRAKVEEADDVDLGQPAAAGEREALWMPGEAEFADMFGTGNITVLKAEDQAYARDAEKAAGRIAELRDSKSGAASS